MYCTNCGQQNPTEAKICSRCGKSINSNEQTVQNVEQMNNVQPVVKKKDISLIIAFITIGLSFIFQIFTIPLAIVGIVFGFKEMKRNGKTGLGLILNAISIPLSMLILYVYVTFIFNTTNILFGTWNCESYDGGDYIVTMKLNKDKTFMWNKYNEEETNYVKGKYTFEEEDAEIKVEDVETKYSISLKGNEFVVDGEKQDKPYVSEYEMVIVKNKENDKKTAVMINVKSYNMYVCDKE